MQVAPSVKVNGKSVPVTEAETPLLNITLPAGNIFPSPPPDGPPLPAGTTGQSVGHGWVTLLDPLTPGQHTIVIKTERAPAITTKIVV